MDNTPVDIGVFHYVRMAVRRRVPILRSDGTRGHTDPIRNCWHIVLFFDIRLFQKRLDSFRAVIKPARIAIALMNKITNCRFH